MSGVAGFVQVPRAGLFWQEVTTSRVVLLPYTAASVGIARRRLVADLVSAGILEAVAADAAIVVSELISNALRHARPLHDATQADGALRVAWGLGADHVEVAVSDGGGETMPTLGNPVQSSTSGRGLGIVDRLCTRWGIRQGNEGEMTVWAEVPIPDAAHNGSRSVTPATTDA
jgi:anti-sigma regulatory factor (Ser/Thr protein kinase)